MVDARTNRIEEWMGAWTDEENGGSTNGQTENR